MSELKRNSQCSSPLYNLGFTEKKERRTNLDRLPIDSPFGPQPSRVFEGLQKLRTTIGISGIIKHVRPDKNRVGIDDFGVGYGQR